MWIRSLIVILLVLILVGCASTGGYPTRAEKVEDKLSSLQSKFFLPAVDVLSVYSSKTTETERRKTKKGRSGLFLTTPTNYSVRS